MHPSLQYRPTPPSQLPYVPSVHGFRPTGHRVDLGFVPREPAPPVEYRPLPRATQAPQREGARFVQFEDKACLGDCGQSFTPRSSNHLRCDPCAKAWRADKASRRKISARTRASTTRLKPLTTREIDHATRARAARSHAARRKVAA